MTESISRKFSRLGLGVSETGTLTVNSATATKWATARTLTLSGDLSGNVSIDGSENVTLTATVSGNTVALGTDTTGDYVASVAAGTGITTTGTGEGAAVTVAIDGTVTTLTGSQTLTNKTIALGSNTVSGTLAQFNTAVTDADFASLAGSETLTNKTLTSPVISSISNTGTLTLPTSTDTLVGRATTDTLTNKTISGADNTISNIGNASLTNSSITINGTSVSLGGTRTLVTDDVAEDGSPINLWYTDARARSAITVTDAGGDGSLSYVSGTGVLTYTGPSATEVRAHFSAGTGVTITSGQVAIGQAVATTDNVTFAGVTVDNIRVGVTAVNEIDTSTGNLVLDSTGGTITLDDNATVTGNLQVDGNLTVSGTTVTINATNLAVEDNMIYLNNGSAVTNPDLGIAGNYNDGTYRHAGVFRDATDGVFKFFHQYTPEPDASAFIDTAHASFALAAIQASTFTGNVTGDVTGNASTATTWQTARTLTLTGDVTGTSASFNGSGNISISTTIAADSVALGTDTTGNYVASITNGNYITGGNGGSEGAALTLAVDATSANTASKVVARDASGNFSAGTITATLSGNASTVTNGVYTTDTGTVTNTMLAGSIANTKLANSTISGVSLGGTLATLTLGVSGTGLSGSQTYNGSGAATFTVTSNATSANTASTIVARDASGNFSAGTITATLSGNSSTVGGLSPAQFFNNMGNNHNTYTDFNNVPGFGTYYVQQGGNSPTGTTSHQWYGFTIGLGNEYALGSYATQFYWPRRAQNSDTYIYVRDREGGTWTSWAKIKAGYADTAGALSSMNISQFTNNSGYITGLSFDGLSGKTGGTGTYTTSGDFRAPIFYDSNDTGYYTDPNGISRVWGIAIRGDNSSTGTENQIFFWSTGNTTTSAIGFKANGGYFGNPTGNGDGYNTYFTMDSDGRGWVFRRGAGGADFSASYTAGWILNNGIAQFNASTRSPIFYDSNNTGYYMDPASGTNLAGTLTNNGGTAMAGGWNRNLYLASTFPVIVFNSNNTKYSGIGVDYSVSAGGFYFWVNGSSADVPGTATVAMTINTGNFVTANGSFRSPIFYDSDNTGYYLDPHSSSNLNTLYVNDWYYVNGGGGLYFNSYGRGLRSPDAAGNSYGTVTTHGSGLNGWHGWGIGTRHVFMSTTGDNVGVHDNSRGWIWYWNGSYTEFPYGYTIHGGSSRSPIFYDQNDTGYYVDPASTSVTNQMRALYFANYYDVASDHPFGIYFASGLSTAYAIFRESGAWSWPYPDLRIAFHTGIKFGANASYKGMNFYTDYDMSGLVMSVNNADYVTSGVYVHSDLRTPIMYDANDTTYYCNPASTSYMYRTIFQGRMLFYGGDQSADGTNDAQIYFTPGGGLTIASITTSFETGFVGSSYPQNRQVGAQATYDKRFYVWQDLVQYYSDERLKEKTGTLVGALDAIKSWTPFKYVDNALANSFNFGSDRTQIGLSAQEVQQYYPELVELAPFDVHNDFSDETNPRRVSKSGENYLTLNYTRLVPVLIQAIKEQQAKIEELENRINNS